MEPLPRVFDTLNSYTFAIVQHIISDFYSFQSATDLLKVHTTTIQNTGHSQLTHKVQRP